MRGPWVPQTPFPPFRPGTFYDRAGARKFPRATLAHEEGPPSLRVVSGDYARGRCRPCGGSPRRDLRRLASTAVCRIRGLGQHRCERLSERDRTQGGRPPRRSLGTPPLRVRELL